MTVMNEFKNIFLHLLCLGLWGETEKISTFHFSPEMWKCMRQMSMVQTVQGIIYDGVLQLPLEERPSEQLMQKWGVQVKQIEEENKKQLVQLVQLRYYFDTEHQLSFRLLKGQSVARHYRNPLHRYCGDLDLWFGTDERVEQANRLMEAVGIKVLRGNDGGGEYRWYGTPVEHKSRLVELDNPFLQKRLKSWEHEVFENSLEEPTPEANLLLQITHILKHYIKGGGLGFRHLCDLAVSFRALEYDADILIALCKEFGVYGWADMLASLIHQALGVPMEELPFPCKENPEPLFEEMWIAGNFGIGDSRFGEHPSGRWGSKFYTARKVWHKTKVFYKVAPGECFWNLLSMVGNNIVTLFRRN